MGVQVVGAPLLLVTGRMGRRCQDVIAFMKAACEAQQVSAYATGGGVIKDQHPWCGVV
jgi:hypothetical protein